MTIETAELDQMQKLYKAAVEDWIAAIRQEEALASVNHDVADVDKWEAAHSREEDLRNNVLAAKKRYEDALREEFFGF
ncbi:MAG: hypothetical protein WBW13_22755 [Pseudolabrys sp.]|jgi:energy-converting hydrogenase A subunit M|nr:hypothetical protein [Pseudolabrys sp.]